MRRAACIGATFALATFALVERAHAEPAVQWFDANDERVAPTPPTEPPARPRIAFLELAATGTMRRHLDIPFALGGGEAALSIVPRSGVVAINLALEYLRGESPNGLGVGTARFATTVSGIMGRFRVGIGAGLSYLWIARVSDGPSIARSGVNLHVQGSYDVLKTESVTLFIRPRAELDPFWGGTTAYGASASIGARF